MGNSQKYLWKYNVTQCRDMQYRTLTYNRSFLYLIKLIQALFIYILSDPSFNLLDLGKYIVWGGSLYA